MPDERRNSVSSAAIKHTCGAAYLGNVSIGFVVMFELMHCTPREIKSREVK
jgi:hypothetical protein